MGKLIRRNVTAVEARRVPAPAPIAPAAQAATGPQEVFVPGSPAMSSAPGPQPHVTQNFFHVTMPPPASAQPSQTPPPATEIHVHHNAVNYTRPPAAPSRGLSFFGSAGLVLGGLACAAVYLSNPGGFARPLALAGLAAGALGMLSAVLIGRTGRGVPALALLVSAVGYGWALQSAGQLAPAMQRVGKELPAALPRIQVDTTAGHLDISMKPAAATAIPAAHPAVAPPAPAQHTVPSPQQAVAAQQLEAVRMAAAQRMGLDYANAKAEAERTASELNAARATDMPGSPQLIAASQACMNANSTLANMRARLRSDPAVAAAETAAK